MSMQRSDNYRADLHRLIRRIAQYPDRVVVVLASFVDHTTAEGEMEIDTTIATCLSEAHVLQILEGGAARIVHGMSFDDGIKWLTEGAGE